MQKLNNIRKVYHTHIWSQDGEHNILTTHIILGKDLDSTAAGFLKTQVRERLKDLGIDHATIETEYNNDSSIMRRIILFLILIVFLNSGCQTITPLEPNNSHAASHQVTVEVDKSSIGFNKASIQHVYYNHELYLEVEGSLKGMLFDKGATGDVHAIFIDKNGQIINKKDKGIVFLDRTNVYMDTNEPFAVYIKDHPEIAKCVLSLDWKPKNFR